MGQIKPNYYIRLEWQKKCVLVGECGLLLRDIDNIRCNGFFKPVSEYM